mgnify:CR=1 FL=1
MCIRDRVWVVAVEALEGAGEVTVSRVRRKEELFGLDKEGDAKAPASSGERAKARISARGER